MTRIGEDGTTHEWCKDCNGYRLVVDEHAEATIEGGYMRRSTTEVTYWVTDLACGHSLSSRINASTYRDPA